MSDYRMEHRAPGNDGYSANATDLTPLMPDVYEHPEWYDTEAEPATVELVRSMRGNPDLPVMVYRAAPATVVAINPGDWVTLEEGYARAHAVQDDDAARDWPVLSMTVRAGDLWSEGGELREFGYDPAR